jgi:hypothetical protein
MASTTPRAPELYGGGPVVNDIGDFHVDELASDMAGSLSPYGTELEFPLPLDQLRYRHPGPQARPNLADGR